MSLKCQIVMLMSDVYLAVFSLDLDKVNDDGPSLKLKAGFSVSFAEPHGAFYQNDAMDNQSEGSCCTGMNNC